MERKIEPFELRSWVNEIYKYPSFFESLSIYQKEVLIDFVKREKSKEMLELNEIYLKNPALKLGEVTIDYLEQLKRVQQILDIHSNPRVLQKDAVNTPELIQTLMPGLLESKTDKLKIQLGELGFFDLPIVKKLNVLSQTKLVETIISNKLPYQIAMLHYLGFINHLEKEHLPIKYKLYRKISELLCSDKDGRAVKGNLSSLLSMSTANKDRYTAHLHKESVKKDYENLK